MFLVVGRVVRLVLLQHGSRALVVHIGVLGLVYLNLLCSPDRVGVNIHGRGLLVLATALFLVLRLAQLQEFLILTVTAHHLARLEELELFFSNQTLILARCVLVLDHVGRALDVERLSHLLFLVRFRWGGLLLTAFGLVLKHILLTETLIALDSSLLLFQHEQAVLWLNFEQDLLLRNHFSAIFLEYLDLHHEHFKVTILCLEMTFQVILRWLGETLVEHFHARVNLFQKLLEVRRLRLQDERLVDLEQGLHEDHLGWLDRIILNKHFQLRHRWDDLTDILLDLPLVHNVFP